MLPKTLFEIFAQYVKSDGLEDVGRVFCSRLLAAIAIKIQPSTPVFAALQAHAQLFIVGCIGIVPQLAAVSKPPFREISQYVVVVFAMVSICAIWI
ncbi:hypothetical protein BST95_19050 [Halioglobus japonicus]|nr:hypothetical protein BST95_19050 [Halioglobus japonicus]